MSKSYVHIDEHGVMRVGKSHVMLDSVVASFEQGYSAETIQQQYPALSLEDVYGAIAWYLAHSDKVSEYLKRRQLVWDQWRAKTTANPARWLNACVLSRHVSLDSLVSRRRFLADHDLNEHILVGVQRREPAIEFKRTRDIGISNSRDAEILEDAGRHGCIVVSHDVNTMPAEAYTRHADGKTIAGLLMVQQTQPVVLIMDNLTLIFTLFCYLWQLFSASSPCCAVKMLSSTPVIFLAPLMRSLYFGIRCIAGAPADCLDNPTEAASFLLASRRITAWLPTVR